MVMAAGAGQRRPVQSLEQRVDEAVVTASVVRKCLGRDDIVGATDIALSTQMH